MKAHRPNIVFIITDTQSQCMVGAYGSPAYRTPNLDALAASGLRCDRAYTACPLCTPARGTMFSGLLPSTNGAYANEMSPMRHVPLAGERFRELGYRAAYTGKWHLDGAGYHGSGKPDGGFEADWWYDGRRYLDDVGEDRAKAIIKARRDADALRAMGVTEQDIWGHRVADQAIDFLERVGDDPFFLTVSFDEPHGPFAVPPDYADAVDPATLPERPNYNAPLDGKPAGHVQQASEFPCPSWREYAADRAAHWNCNTYVDREIGRVVDAVQRLHGDDTYIIYTADHGDMMGSHGLRSKGAMMYEESICVPFIVAGPGIAAGGSTRRLVSHADLLPTWLALAGADVPPALPGRDLRPLFSDPTARVRDTATVQYNRFGLYHQGSGDFIPIRCLMNERYKLVINLHDRDELYDLDADPYEMTNRIDDSTLATDRDALHDALLTEMDAISDPLRGDAWRNRPWRAGHVHTPFFRQPVSHPPAGLRHGTDARPTT